MLKYLPVVQSDWSSELSRRRSTLLPCYNMLLDTVTLYSQYLSQSVSMTKYT